MREKKHPAVFFEIGCYSGEKTRAFFAELFNWEIADPNPSFQINTGEGIGGHIVELAPEWGNYVTVYIEVEDVERYLNKANELGGKTLIKPVTIPGQGTFAWLASPEGNIIGIWRPETDPEGS